MTNRPKRVPYLCLWLLFLVFCLGMGYAGVKRYDVRAAGGMNDVRVYYQMVELGAGWQEPIWLHRALIPAMARPVYLALRGRTGSWDAVYLSLLLWNAALTALTALVVFLLGRRVASPGAGLIASLIYLLNFQIANYVLTGMVDSLQALTLAGMVWFLLRDEWKWVAAIALVGSAGKETTMVLAAALIAGWVLANRKDYGWGAACIVAAVAGTQVMPLALTGKLSNYLALAESQKYYPWGGVGKAVLECLGSWSLWLTVGWGLPMAWKERARFGRAWWTGAGFGVGVTLALGAWSVAGPNVARPIFFLLGPILCIGTAEWLVGRYGGERAF